MCIRDSRKFRNEFVLEMRSAVDPHVRGEDIEKLVAEKILKANKNKSDEEE